MTKLSIELPEPIAAYLQAQIAAGSYTDPSSYIEILIQQDIDRQHHLGQKLLESLASPASPVRSTDWDDIRRQVRQNLDRGAESA